MTWPQPGGLSPTPVSLDSAKAAIRRRLAHMGSLCRRLAGRCLGEMSVEECARLFFRVLGRRLVVFEPEAAIADAGSQQSDIEIMMDSGINNQGDRRVIAPGMRCHFTALLYRVPFIGL